MRRFGHWLFVALFSSCNCEPLVVNVSDGTLASSFAVTGVLGPDEQNLSTPAGGLRRSRRHALRSRGKRHRGLVTRRFLIIGNPENRRVGLFTEALMQQGLPAPDVVPWLELLKSGSVLVSVGPRTAEIRTSLEWEAPRFFNNLNLSHYRKAEDVHRALAFVLEQGAQVERAIPKAKLEDAFFDCRVLCIGGEPRFVVVRQNKHAITNLHLGGWRGDVEGLKTRDA